MSTLATAQADDAARIATRKPLKADIAAADRLLKAAVKKAERMIREAGTHDPTFVVNRGSVTWRWRRKPDYDHEAVVGMLTAAGQSAELLLEGIA